MVSLMSDNVCLLALVEMEVRLGTGGVAVTHTVPALAGLRTLATPPPRFGAELLRVQRLIHGDRIDQLLKPV